MASSRSAAAAALAVVLLLAGCGAGQEPQVDVSVAPPPGCATSGMAVTAPAAGAAVAAGPLLVAGSTPAASSTVYWSVRDGAGLEVSSGSTAGTGNSFLAPVDLAAGPYTAQLWSVASDGSCAVTGTALQVDPAGAPRWSAAVAGEGVPDGSFGSWRGSPVPMAGTWADSTDGQTALWPLTGEYASWTGDLEIAIGAIDSGAGESWAAAAQGAYDARWTESLQQAARLWSGHSGTLYIRFAHEFNGDWYPWSVTQASVGDFVTSWQRFRALQQQLFPASRLVFSPNWESDADFGGDWRAAFPGAGQVDVLSTSYYNNWSYVDTAQAFGQLALTYDPFGGPRGLQRHLEFARSVGLPFGISEWGAESGFGDSAVYVEQMYGFFNANAGTGGGQLQYEILFNELMDSRSFSLFPTTSLPNTAAAYARLW
ncbi:hypothetical protein [Modestobacter versicolor]|uniref:hypothetical protein n=1 Tax=Modestobacter versicolor TaxID=429133 RepID=UPI0034E04149